MSFLRKSTLFLGLPAVAVYARNELEKAEGGQELVAPGFSTGKGPVLIAGHKGPGMRLLRRLGAAPRPKLNSLTGADPAPHFDDENGVALPRARRGAPPSDLTQTDITPVMPGDGPDGMAEEPSTTTGTVTPCPDTSDDLDSDYDPLSDDDVYDDNFAEAICMTKINGAPMDLGDGRVSAPTFLGWDPVTAADCNALIENNDCTMTWRKACLNEAELGLPEGHLGWGDHPEGASFNDTPLSFWCPKECDEKAERLAQEEAERLAKEQETTTGETAQK